MNLYQYIFNNPLGFVDYDGQFAFAIPLLIWGAELVFPSLSAIVWPIVYGTVAAGVSYGGYKLGEVLARNCEGATHYIGQPYIEYYNARHDAKKEARQKEEGKKPRFDGKELGEDPSKCPE